MDEGLHEPVKATRLLAWLAAGLLVAGAVSAGAVSGNNAAEDRRIVSAAGSGLAGVDAPTTTAEVGPPPKTTAVPVVTSTTTAPAPATTATPPTTKAPRPTTTTTKAPATTTTKAAGVRLTVVNQHPSTVKVIVNGRTFTLAAGEKSGPVGITTEAHGNDVVEVTLVQAPSCGSGDADSYFPKPGNYTMTIVAGPGLCQPGMPGPVVKVTQA